MGTGGAHRPFFLREVELDARRRSAFRADGRAREARLGDIFTCRTRVLPFGVRPRRDLGRDCRHPARALRAARNEPSAGALLAGAVGFRRVGAVFLRACAPAAGDRGHTQLHRAALPRRTVCLVAARAPRPPPRRCRAARFRRHRAVAPTAGARSGVAARARGACIGHARSRRLRERQAARPVGRGGVAGSVLLHAAFDRGRRDLDARRRFSTDLSFRTGPC